MDLRRNRITDIGKGFTVDLKIKAVKQGIKTSKATYTRDLKMVQWFYSMGLV